MTKNRDSGQPLLNFTNARTPEQIAIMERARDSGDCPFCREHLAAYHPRPILREGKYWLVTENMSPYKNTKLHFLFVYTPSHVVSVDEIPLEAFSELLLLLNEVRGEYSIKGGTLILRFGDNRYNGGSVSHLHAQLVVGDADAPDHQPVRTKIG